MQFTTYHHLYRENSILIPWHYIFWAFFAQTLLEIIDFLISPSQQPLKVLLWITRLSIPDNCKNLWTWQKNMHIKIKSGTFSNSLKPL